MYRADTSDGRQAPKGMMMMQGMNYVERHVTEVPMLRLERERNVA